MQIKSAKPKSERPAAGQNRSASATKKSRVGSENGLTTAALATGLLAENGNSTSLKTGISEPAVTRMEAEAVPVGDAPDNAQPLALTTDVPADDGVSAIPESGDAASADQPSESAPTIEAEPIIEPSAEPIIQPTAEPLVPTAPVGETSFNAALPPTRTGLVQSPLAARMLAEAAERRGGSRTGKSGRSSRAVDTSLGEAFVQADARVKDLKAQLNEARRRVQGAADPALSAQITALRAEIRAARSAKVEGIAPFDLAIATARAALEEAKSAKRGFLASQGLGVPGPTSAGPSLRQELRALRSRISESVSLADSAELTQLRAAYRAAKADRQAKALAPLPTPVEAGIAEQDDPGADAEPKNDAPTGENADINDADINDAVTGHVIDEEDADADNDNTEGAV